MNTMLKVLYLINPVRIHGRLLGSAIGYNLAFCQRSTYTKRLLWFIFDPFEVLAVKVG